MFKLKLNILYIDVEHQEFPSILSKIYPILYNILLMIRSKIQWIYSTKNESFYIKFLFYSLQILHVNQIYVNLNCENITILIYTSVNMQYIA